MHPTSCHPTLPYPETGYGSNTAWQRRAYANNALFYFGQVDVDSARGAAESAKRVQIDSPSAAWSFYLHELRRFREEHGSLDVPFKWRDPSGDFSNAFAKWVHAQPGLFALRRLAPQQARRLLRLQYSACMCVQAYG